MKTLTTVLLIFVLPVIAFSGSAKETFEGKPFKTLIKVGLIDSTKAKKKDLSAEARAKAERVEVKVTFHVTKLPDNRYLVSVPNPKTDKVYITITGSVSGMIHTEVVKPDGDFARLYRILNLDREDQISFKLHTVKQR